MFFSFRRSYHQQMLLYRSLLLEKTLSDFLIKLQSLNKDISEESEHERAKMKESAVLSAILNKQKQRNISIINGIESVLNGTTNDITNKEESGNKEESK